jgi:hypothetical protein
MNKLRSFIFVLLSLALFSGILLAQVPTGKIIGTVTDNEGSPLPGVTVGATSPKLVGKASAITDVNGVYRLLVLPPGTYKITFALQGFNTVIREDIVLTLEQTLTVNVSMTPGKIEEEITVTGKVPLIDVKSTIKGMNLTKEMFELLPKGRNFDTLITAIPGVNNEPYLGGISVDGASGGENMFYVDGMDISHLDSGIRGQSAVFEFVEEVQIKASGYQAEFGGSMGGVVNVISRSGGNEFHGELTGYYSGSMLTTKERDTQRLSLYDVTKAEYVNYEDLYGKDKYNSYEVGFNFGGYILKNKLWFFGSFLPRFDDTTRHVHWIPEGVAADSDNTRNQPYWNASVKISSQPIKNLRLSANFIDNFSKYRGDLPSRDGISIPNKPWSQYGFDYPNWSGSLTADYVIGNNFIISARGGYFFSDTNNQQVQPSGPRYYFRKQNPGPTNTTNAMFPEIPASYVKPVGWSNMPTSELYVSEKQIRDRATGNLDLTYYLKLAGEHALKAGVQWARIEEDIDNSAKYEQICLGWNTAFQFLGTGETVTGKYGHYSVEGGKSGPYGTYGNPSSIRWSIYLQDSWTPHFLKNKLTLNFGVRAEKEDVPSFSNLPGYDHSPVKFSFADKIAPRFGFIYDLFGDSSLKIFGSFGLYYDVMKLDLALSKYGGLKWISDYYTLDDWDFYKIGNGNYPGTYITSYNWRLPGFDVTDPNLMPTVQSELSFGAEKKIAENFSASIRVVYKHLIHTIHDAGILTPAGELYYVCNPGFGITLKKSKGGWFPDEFPDEPIARREYWAVNFNFEKRLSQHWFGGGSYTWSRLWGNYSGLGNSDEWGRLSPNHDRRWDQWWCELDKNLKEVLGPLNTDRPHQFKFYGSYVFDFGLTLGLVANAMSGIPISREFDPGTEGYHPDGRLTDGRTPFLFFTNAYVEYKLKMTDKYRILLSLNVDNVFDTKTARRVYTKINQGAFVISDEERLAGSWTYDLTNHTVTTIKGTRAYVPDPRFLQGFDFYPPLSARIGVKIIF